MDSSVSELMNASMQMDPLPKTRIVGQFELRRATKVTYNPVFRESQLT